MLSKRSFVRRSAVLAAALLASAVVSAVRAAEPAVLTLVPGDAYGVVVINNVRTFANKAANAATRLNLPLPPDLVGAATRNLGITKGFDANSSAALVLLKPSAEKLAEGYFNGQPPAVILLPTSDAKGMMEPFSPGAADAKGISQVTLPSNPDEKGYVAVIEDKWIVFAQNRDDLTAYLARGASFAKTASPETLKVFENNDVVAWANVEKLGEGLDKVLDERQVDFAGMMDLANNVAAQQDKVAIATQKATIAGMFALTKQYLKDAKAAMITARLTDSGATLGMVGDFKPDSLIGKFVASQAAGGPVTLKGLPGGNFLAAAAMKWDSASISQVFGDFEARVLADPDVAKDPRAAELAKGFDTAKQIIALTRGTSIVLLDPPAGGKDGIINGAMLVDTTDAKKYLDLQIKVLQGGMAQAMNPGVVQNITVNPDGPTVSGVQLTKVTMKFDLKAAAGDNAMDPQAQAMVGEVLQRIYGANGLTVYMGVVGNKVLSIYGSDQTTLEAAVAAAKGNTDALATSPAIAATKDQVVANPIAFAYLPITRWVTLAQAMMKPGAAPASGAAAAGAAIANAPPVVVSMGVSGKMLTEELHVPIATITGVQEAVKRLQEAMEGGPGPGAPALP